MLVSILVDYVFLFVFLFVSVLYASLLAEERLIEDKTGFRSSNIKEGHVLPLGVMDSHVFVCSAESLSFAILLGY